MLSFDWYWRQVLDFSVPTLNKTSEIVVENKIIAQAKKSFAKVDD
jgi:hypothetical protein